MRKFMRTKVEFRETDGERSESEEAGQIREGGQ